MTLAVLYIDDAEQLSTGLTPIRTEAYTLKARCYGVRQCDSFHTREVSVQTCIRGSSHAWFWTQEVQYHSEYSRCSEQAICCIHTRSTQIKQVGRIIRASLNTYDSRVKESDCC